MILRNTLIGSFNVRMKLATCIMSVIEYNLTSSFYSEYYNSHSQFDVGLVYDEPDHAIIHKWLLLTDPDDVTSEAKVRSV